MKRYISVLLASMMILTAAGCSANAPSSSSPEIDDAVTNGISAADKSDGASSAASAGDSLTVGASGAPEAAPEIGFADEREESIFDGGVMDDYDIAADSAVGEFAGAPGDFVVDDGGDIDIEEPYIQPQAGLLTGGEWRDNDHWNDWVSLYQSHEDWNSYLKAWEADHAVRHEVIVTAYGKPLEGAQVSQRNCGNIGVTSAVTDNQGRAYLFLDECNDDMEHTLEVTYGEVRMTIEDVDSAKSGTYTIDFTESLGENEVGDIQALELMLMIDTTGSMWDELAYIQAELEDVISRVKSDNGNIPVRVSVNFYRDEYDEYIIREFDFTDDINKAISDLREQSADGGGDTPEAVHTALNSVVRNHEWREDATKLMFFVLDAPPHSDAQIIDEVNNCVEIAAAQGIRIIPVASSGIDKSTEYLLRTMAFRTGGTYTFLTNHSGIGGDHIEPTIGDYEVEKLNDMMVRIINDYLS